MATLLHSESRRLYSWWWDSHISPKNSKWLQENLKDMDAKVKAMIKLIEEDADSFARRAEMYYKKRPELMKLVEEFYRAYRALAERYDHATGELRQAHRTIAQAFPNQEQFALSDDSPSGSSPHERDPQTPEMLHPLRLLLDQDDFGSVNGKRGLKQLYEMFGALENSKLGEEKERNLEGEFLQLPDEHINLKNRVLTESDRASKAENEIERLKKELNDLHNEKEVVLRQYQETKEKLSNLERELDHARISSKGLDEEASKATAEVQKLKEALLKLEAERDAALLKLNECKARILELESTVSIGQKDAEGLNERAIRAETEAQSLEKELSRLKIQKNAVCGEYEQCLQKVSDLERKLSLTQDESKLINEKADRAENELRTLNKALAELTEDKEDIVRRYEHCLKKISKLESELSSAQEDIKRLNSVVVMEAEKLKIVEEKCVLLETSNQSLQLEADNLEKNIRIKNEEISKKREELEKVQSCLQNEHNRFIQAESSLITLQNLQSQSQKEQKALALELKKGLQMLKEMERRKHGLEEEIQQVKDENKMLNEQGSSSKTAMENLQSEISRLKEMKERLEEEVESQIGQTNSLQKELYSLNKDIEGLNTRYQALVEQIESVGLDPESIESSVKDLQDENLKLRKLCEEERDEKGKFLKKLDDMMLCLDKNALLESSLSTLSGELEKSQENVKALQESCQSLQGEKTSLIDEKAVILSQLQIITENLQKLLERNGFLENSLSSANTELSALREKATCLEELCKSLNNEKSNLLTERSTLVVQLGNVEQRLENLEKRFAELGKKYADLEKEKESTLSQVEELKICLDEEKQERASVALSTEARLTRLENHVHFLQEESRSRKKEFEEQLDKAVNAQFEIFVLQKFIQDMEQKNYSLLFECQKHVEASKLTDKVILELESENLEQQVEAELLLDEIEKLRMGIYQVFKALEISPHNELVDKSVDDQKNFHQVIDNIEDMKFSLSNYEDDKDQLLVENSVLLTLFGQLMLEISEIESEKKVIENELKIMTEQIIMVQNEKREVMEINGQLKSQVNLGDQQMTSLRAEMERLCEEQGDKERAYLELQDEYSLMLEENRSLLKNLSELEEKNGKVEEENKYIILETLALDNISMVFKHYGTEKVEELKSVSEVLHNLYVLNTDLEKDIGGLRGKLEMKETEDLLLKNTVKKLEEEIHEVRDCNNQLTCELSVVKDFIYQKELEISEAKQKHKAMEDLNSELCRNMEELKRRDGELMVVIENLENQNSKILEKNKHQKVETEQLCEDNGSLEAELGILREEIEERKIREDKLSSELQEISNEFEMWEAEAETFHFDLQISTVREVLLENKVHELTGVCENLKDERDSKTVVLEQMKQRISLRETEICGLKDQLFAYVPVIDSLRDNIASLEHNILSQQEFNIDENRESKDVELAVELHEESSKESMEDDKSLISSGVSELQHLQDRIKEVEKVVIEEMRRLTKKKSSNTNIKLEAAFKEIEELKSTYILRLEKGKQKEESKLKDELGEKVLQKTKPELFGMKNGILMKDIPLDHISNGSLYGISRRRNRRADDQMLELWETSEDDHSLDRIRKKPLKHAIEPMDNANASHQFENVERRSEDTSSELQIEKELGVDKLEVHTSGTESTQDRNKRKILERLDSDALKLKSLQTTVEDLRTKLETNRKRKKAKNVDFETVEEQLQEVEETLVQLVEVNGKLTKNVEENASYSDKKASPELEVIWNLRRKRILDQARKGSEKSGRLQLEVQKIQYILLKLEDDKNKANYRFSKSKTSIILRDFISGRRRSIPKRKKSRFCGCFRTPSKGEGSSINAVN